MEAKQELEQVELWARQVAQALGIGAELVKELLTQQRYREPSQMSPLTALARWKRQGHELGTFSVEESLGESFGRCLKQVHVVYYSVKAEGKEAFIFRDKDSATVQQVGREFQHELAGKFQASPAREFQHAMVKKFQDRPDREPQHKLAENLQGRTAREFQHTMVKKFQERSDREPQHKLAENLQGRTAQEFQHTVAEKFQASPAREGLER